MGNKKFKMKLRYRGSRDGWMAEDFHRLCDGIGPTASFFKIKENQQCIGGFTSAQWASPQEGTFITDSTAMLFNLTLKQQFKCINHKAIYCFKDYGPLFGEEELVADEPFNEERNCYSNANKSCYRIRRDSESRSMLTDLICEMQG